MPTIDKLGLEVTLLNWNGSECSPQACNQLLVLCGKFEKEANQYKCWQSLSFNQFSQKSARSCSFVEGNIYLNSQKLLTSRKWLKLPRTYVANKSYWIMLVDNVSRPEKPKKLYSQKVLQRWVGAHGKTIKCMCTLHKITFDKAKAPRVISIAAWMEVS